MNNKELIIWKTARRAYYDPKKIYAKLPAFNTSAWQRCLIYAMKEIYEIDMYRKARYWTDIDEWLGYSHKNILNRINLQYGNSILENE